MATPETKILLQALINSFSTNITLWVIGCAYLKPNPHLFEQSLPELGIGGLSDALA